MTGTTPGWGLRFPDDYGEGADSPLALQDLATDTDTALTFIATKLLPYRLLTRNADVALTANSDLIIGWDAVGTLPPGTTGAAGTNGSVQTIAQSGMYLVELVINVIHGSVGTKATFNVRLDRIAGSDTGEYAAALAAEQVTTGISSRIGAAFVAYFAVGDTYSCRIQPMGASATGWTLTYARHALTQVR